MFLYWRNLFHESTTTNNYKNLIFYIIVWWNRLNYLVLFTLCCVYKFYAWTNVCMIVMPSPYGIQKRVSNTLKLELGMTVSHHVGAGNWTVSSKRTTNLTTETSHIGFYWNYSYSRVVCVHVWMVCVYVWLLYLYVHVYICIHTVLHL